MHIPPFDNKNQAIVDANDPDVPLVYFNIVKLRKGESFESFAPGYETCVVPAHGSIDVHIESENAPPAHFANVGDRPTIWDGDPSAVYVPVGRRARLVCLSETAEVFVAGGRFGETYEPFVVRRSDIDPVQYGSDETKTHRKIKHILGKTPPGRVGRLLVSELFTVGTGGWSGFPPHKHDTDRLPQETHHDEVYNFRFRPAHGFGLQLLQKEDGKIGEAVHLVEGSTVKIAKGYHPCVVAPGHEMYYFTILCGATVRPLVQYFQPAYAGQLATIPGMNDMIAKFR